MPIIVDEIVISVEVGNQAAGGTPPAAGGAADKQEIIAECVERVLDLLALKKER
jgi:hypothetical protein